MSELASEPGVLAGHYHPGLSGESAPARLTLANDEVTIDREDSLAVLARARLSDLTISSRVGSIARKVQFPDRSVFVTPDNEGVDRLLLRRRPLSVHALERFRPHLLVFALAAIALLFGIYRFGLPVLTDLAVAVTPASAERLVGQQVLTIMDKALLKPTGVGPERQERLRAAFLELAGRAAKTGAQYRLEFRGGGVLGPNAFALPWDPLESTCRHASLSIL